MSEEYTYHEKLARGWLLREMGDNASGRGIRDAKYKSLGKLFDGLATIIVHRVETAWYHAFANLGLIRSTDAGPEDFANFVVGQILKNAGEHFYTEWLKKADSVPKHAEGIRQWLIALGESYHETPVS